jgi:hypothetical protein
MIKTLNQSATVRTAMKNGWSLIPLAGVVSQDSEIYRYCLVDPQGLPSAMVGAEAVQELIERGLVPWNSTLDKRSVPLSALPQREYAMGEVDDEDDGVDSSMDSSNSSFCRLDESMRMFDMSRSA